MGTKAFLGLDTSCYTTSLAVVDEKSRVLYQKRLLLPVAKGERGLRQSEAFYQHMGQLPGLFQDMEAQLPFALYKRLAGVAVSVKPCRRRDSYMPVFRAGYALAQSLASAAGVPLVATTHQEGHLMAALWSAGLTEGRMPAADPPQGDTQGSPHGDAPGGSESGSQGERRRKWRGICPFLACHLSGGTTELVLVRTVGGEPGFYFDYSVVSGTLDIPAGQLIDRSGQVLGLPFPAGPYLEQTALSLGRETRPARSIPTYCRGGNISFSGGEAWVKRAQAEGILPAEIARSVEHYIAGSLVKSVSAYLDRPEQAMLKEQPLPEQDRLSREQEPPLPAQPEQLPAPWPPPQLRPSLFPARQPSPPSLPPQQPRPRFILFMGGVAANAYIRRQLQTRLERKLPCFFASPEYSSDNALGTALIGAASLAGHRV